MEAISSGNNTANTVAEVAVIGAATGITPTPAVTDPGQIVTFSLPALFNDSITFVIDAISGFIKTASVMDAVTARISLLRRLLSGKRQWVLSTMTIRSKVQGQCA